jgi:arabinofuranan 3-O-arabinosyltransferase
VIHAPGLVRRRVHAPPDGPAGANGRIPPHTRWFLAFCVLIGALPFLTAPGNLIADTKLDLAVDPGRFLARALTLWDPQQFGQLQDQAAGYLFPMGPFFYLGRLAGLDPWIVQRLWIGLVGVAAFAGTVRLADRLEIGTPWSRIVAGLAYAASPAALSLIGELSSEFLPAAMLPWILIPLVDAAHGGRRGRAAARSAAAVALCGGINAAATIAVLVPPLLYVLTLARPAPRWRILGWWAPAVVLATSWWLIPLALLSRYGVSIIPYTESAAVTTSVTSLSNILRGTENWVSYLLVNGQPWWQLGYRIATGALPTLLTGLAAGLGLAGLLRPRLPARRFLLCLLLTGIVIISAGYVSSLGNPLAGPVAHLINGPASTFRNLRKFDPLVRLPIVLGLAYLLASVRLPRQRAVAAAAVIAVGGVALPAYVGGLAGAGAFRQIPSYWQDAANWLNRHAGHQAVLVEPGASFGQYLWGSPLDDVLQPLTTADWAERDLSVIGSPGNERLLDAIDQTIAAGDGSAAMAQVLARMGVRYVLVRNDLIRPGLDGAWPARVNQALATSPGISKVAQFGQPVGSAAPDDAATNFDPPYPPVEIYQVAGAEPVATVQPAAGTLRVYGGPEALLTLAGEGLMGERPVLLNSDSPSLPAAASVVTDTLRRRVRNFGELRTNYSPTLTATQPLTTFEAAADYTEPGWARYQAVARYYGIRSVTASSSAAGIGAIPGQWASGLLPYSAVDGDTRTMWESGSWTGPVGQWIRLGFDSPVHPQVIRVTFTDSTALGPPVTQVVVTTAAGRVTDQVQVTGAPQALRVPPGPTGWLRITVTRVASLPEPVVGAQVGIKEISVPGVHASREIVAPNVPGSDPAAVVLAKAQPWPSPCMLTSRRWVCSPLLSAPAEEQYGFDQGFTARAAAPATLRGSAVLISPWLVTNYLRLAHGQAWVGASSRYTPAPQDQPRSAFDGNPATTWIASPTDTQPTLTINWGYLRTVSTVTIQRPPGAAGPLPVLLAGSRGQARGGTAGRPGILRFSPMRTSKLTFRFTPTLLPLQISDVVIPGVPQLKTPSGPFRLRCGLGPLVELNGKVLPTRVSGTFAELLTGQPMSFTACRGAVIAAGANRVTEPARDAFDVQDVVLATGGRTALGGAAPGAPSVRKASAVVWSWGPSRRVLEVTAPARSYLVVNENFNSGWRASLGATRLRPVRLDGWKQAWLLPAGTAGVVTLTYVPNALYRDAIFGGLGAVALLMLLVLWAGALDMRRVRGRPAVQIHRPTWLSVPQGLRRPGRPVREGPRQRRLRLGPESPHLRSRIAAALTVAAATGSLVLAGFWLGGYPGAVILVAATGLLAAALRARANRRIWREMSRPSVVTGLLLAVAVCVVAGERLQLAGVSGSVVSVLTNTVPQVICLMVVARLAAALLVGEPGRVPGHDPGTVPVHDPANAPGHDRDFEGAEGYRRS